MCMSGRRMQYIHTNLGGIAMILASDEKQFDIFRHLFIRLPSSSFHLLRFIQQF